MVKFTKKCMAVGTNIGNSPYSHRFLCKFYHIRTAVKLSILNQLTPNFGILQSRYALSFYVSLVFEFFKIKGLVPSPHGMELANGLAATT